MSEERLYTDDEVTEVLSRAVQPIASSAVPARRPSGITLAEIEAAASEAGIDPARVREAALSLGERSYEHDRSLLFGPHTTHVFERVIDGEVPRESLMDLVNIIRRQMRVKGKVEEVGDWLEWTSDGTTIHVSVKAENGQTRLQFMGDAGFKLIGSFVPSAVATLIMLVSLGNSGTLTVPLAIAIVAGAYTVARGLWEYSGERAGKKYRRMVDRLTEEMSRLARPPASDGD